jgi:siderophore synthetase component/RimJ/RimL family protein N-acetyltransferase
MQANNAREVVFQAKQEELGRFALRRLDFDRDMPLIHAWVTREQARYWGMLGMSLEQVTNGYRNIAKTANVYIGEVEGVPAFLLETYFPGHDVVSAHYPVQPGDRGMHVLLAPAEPVRHGFSWAVFSMVMDFLFSDPAAARVVVEPDVRNHKIHRLNRRAGFRYQKLIELPSKTAHLAFCNRAEYLRARAADEPAIAPGLAHLEPRVWERENRALIRKAMAEFSHERMLSPTLERGNGKLGSYVLESGPARYRFVARRLPLDDWDIDAASITKHLAGEPAPLDALDFILEFRDALGIREEILPVYLEEITSTLWGNAFKHVSERLSSHDLLHADFQQLETAMSAGHPTFLANSGRVGFDCEDYARYAPEVGAPIRLIWLAAQRTRAEFSSVAELSYETLLREELHADTLRRFRGELEARGLDGDAYLLIPVHPWQWFNKLARNFASDLAVGDLVCLGYGDDEYRAQQSIRTFFNVSQPERRYVKTALSVLNMGFLRGLSADYMRATPAINGYLSELVSADPLLTQKRFRLLREVAGVGYRNPHFEAALPAASAHRKMLAALWRESPVPLLAPGQRLMTMAALLHRDRDGTALLPLLIRASGLGVDAWLDRYFDGYLVPLVHCLYAYELAFMPHGENLILVLENYAVAGVFMKDIAEEAVIMDPERTLPESVRRLGVSVPDSMKWLSVFTDVFDGFFRHLAQILCTDSDYPSERFWSRVAHAVSEYQRARPELRSKFERYDAFAPSCLHSCLNRLQLRNNQKLVDLADPAGSLAFAGTIENPLAIAAAARTG